MSLVFITSQPVFACILLWLTAWICGYRLVCQACLSLFPLLLFCFLALACSCCLLSQACIPRLLGLYWLERLQKRVATKEFGCWSRRRAPLQGACIRVLFALWSLVAGAAAGCYCRGAAIRALCLLWGLTAGAAAGWPCKVLLLRGLFALGAWLQRCGRVLVPRTVRPHGAAAGCCEMFVLWSSAPAAAGCLCNNCNRKDMQVLPTNTRVCAGLITFL